MTKYANIFFCVIAVIALIISLSVARSHKSVSTAETVIDRNEIRIGYIIYPPLLTKDASTGQLSGISYDIVEAAAAKLNLQTNWVEEVGWGSALEGFKTKRYDILGTQMWPSSARAREAVFSIAPFNSVLYPYVRTGDMRFNDGLSKLNDARFTISTIDGSMDQIIAKEDYPQAKETMLPQLSSFSEVFLNIINNKADITFVEPSAAHDFMKSNPGKITRVETTPVRVFGNSFAFARGEESMVSMWNVAIGELINDGSIARILEKHSVTEDYILNK